MGEVILRRLLIIIIGTTLLVACGNGNVGGQVINGSDTSLSDGQLDKSTLSIIYSTPYLQSVLQNNILCPGLQSSDCQTNLNNLATNYNFNLAQVESYTDSVAAYQITYGTTDYFGNQRLVSGGVLIPNVVESQLKGIILFDHPTVVTKYDVPSCYGGQSAVNPSYCHSGSIVGEELASLFAAADYVVVMPDYNGQGIDEGAMHPYILYPQVNAMTGINMLIATRQFLNSSGYSNNIPLNLYITGFSEGGSYALWTSKLLQTSENSVLTNQAYNLKYTAGISGAYDLTNAQMPMESANEDSISPGNNPFNIYSISAASSAKPVLIAYALTAYGYFNANQTYNAMNQAFFNCQVNSQYGIGVCPAFFNGNNYNLADLFTLNNDNFNETNITGAVVASSLSTDYNPLGNGSNAGTYLVADGLFSNPEFNSIINAADIANWNSSSKIGLIYLAQDSVVTNLNSINAFTGISVQSAANTVESQVVDNNSYFYYNQTTHAATNIDHQQSSPFALIAALMDFNNNP